MVEIVMYLNAVRNKVLIASYAIIKGVDSKYYLSSRPFLSLVDSIAFSSVNELVDYYREECEEGCEIETRGKYYR